MTDALTREIVVITGGRDRTPTLAEIERLDLLLHGDATAPGLGAKIVREGEARGTDKAVAAYLRARKRVEVESWPASWDQHGKAAGHIRNKAMLAGAHADGRRPPANVVVSFDGGKGTEGCRIAALDAGLPVLRIHAIEEPRPWNMHHGEPPGRLVYAGRSPRWGGPSPLANPVPVQLEPGESMTQAAARLLGDYKRWLWPKIDPASARRDARVCEALALFKPGDYIGCTCWPRPCHVEVLIRAWRWLMAKGRT